MKNLPFFLFLHTHRYVALPLLCAIYPAVFHYVNNVQLVLFSSFIELCIFLAVIGSMIYIVLAVFSRGKFLQSAVGASLVVLFFHTYGFVFDWLRSIDVFQVEVYSFLPFWIFAALYFAWIIRAFSNKLANQLWTSSILVISGLLLFNLIQIAPVALENSKDNTAVNNTSVPVNNSTAPNQQYPDIYYLVFDEGAGFEVLRDYWNYKEVDTFADFLKSNGFYVAENSHGHSDGTLYEMTTRFNYQIYPLSEDVRIRDLYNTHVGDNLVMDYLKKHGYTLIAYDEKRLYLPTLSPLPVDHLIEESPEEFVANNFIHIDDYKSLALENTMLRSYISQAGQDPLVAKHRNLILYTVNNVASAEFPSPKFVHVHLLLPHVPFIFRENGDLQLEGGFANWQKYFENYKYFLSVAPQMIENILAASDPNNPPVIIVQSDHGARNITEYPYTGYLENYPDEYTTLIINALYLPGCDDALLTQDMDPLNTFPIIFNCYFGDDIPLK